MSAHDAWDALCAMRLHQSLDVVLDGDCLVATCRSCGAVQRVDVGAGNFGVAEMQLEHAESCEEWRRYLKAKAAIYN